MAQIKIESVLNGIGANKYFQGDGQYQSAVGIDPDLSINKVESSGMLIPTAVGKFSSTNVNGIPMWITTVPNRNTIYTLIRVSDTTHRLVSYSSTAGTSETLVADTSALSAGSGNGLIYYNNYLYIFGNNDVDRYGPLNGTPTITKSWWIGTLHLTPLTNISIPTIFGCTYIPNHMPYTLSGKLYFCDYAGNRGIINKIETKAADLGTFKGEWSSATAYVINDVVYSSTYGKHYISVKNGTNQAVVFTEYWSIYDTGSTDDGSAYDVIDIPTGYLPTTLSQWEDYLVIGANQISPYGVNTGPAELFLWDQLADDFFREIKTSNPVITAMKNINGTIYLFTGTSSAGMSLEKYTGGLDTQIVLSLGSSLSPSQGAVDVSFGKLYWGTRTNNPDYYACVYSYGTKDSQLNPSLHNIIRATCTATFSNGVVSAFSIVGGSLATPLYFVGWWTKDAADPYTSRYGIDGYSSTYQTVVWRSPMYRMENDFKINKVEIPLGATLAGNMTITPKVYVDDESTSFTLNTINSTNYSGRRVKIFPQNCKGMNNFFLELTWSGTTLCPVLLPIIINYDYIDVNPK